MENDGFKERRRGKLSGQPQKPRSAFFLWLNAEGRDKTKAENPGLSWSSRKLRKEASKKAGEVWNKIDSETKNRFVEEAKAEMEKYQQDYKEWLQGGGKEALKAAKAEAKELKREAKRLKREAKQLKKSFKKKSHFSSTTLPEKTVKSAEFVEDAGSCSDHDDKDGN